MNTFGNCDLIIVGASGFVGSNLIRYFAQRCSVVGTYCKRPMSTRAIPNVTYVHLDVTDADEIERVFATIKPKTVLHVAGNKNVKYCEQFPERAYLVNSVGTRNVATGCRRHRAQMIYLSTDLVFDGKRSWYAENEVPSPSTIYGLSKLKGEILARKELKDLAICRSGGIYGRGCPLFNWAEKHFLEERPLNCFINIFNTPTYATNLAEMIDCIIVQNLTGTFHTAGSQRLSRHEFFFKYAEHFERDQSLITTAIYDSTKYDLLLLPDASLSTEITRSILGMEFLSVDDGLSQMSRERGES